MMIQFTFTTVPRLWGFFQLRADLEVTVTVGEEATPFLWEFVKLMINSMKMLFLSKIPL